MTEITHSIDEKSKIERSNLNNHRKDALLDLLLSSSAGLVMGWHAIIVSIKLITRTIDGSSDKTSAAVMLIAVVLVLCALAWSAAFCHWIRCAYFTRELAKFDREQLRG